MNKYIPSYQISDYLEEINHIFTDSELATIIWNSNFNLLERLEDLSNLAKSTTDKDLQHQIYERLNYEYEKMCMSKENIDKQFIFVVLDTDEIAWGYFQEFELALKQAMNICGKCRIEKQLIITGTDIPSVEYSIRWNPNLVSKRKTALMRNDYCGDPVAYLTLDKDGNIIDVYSTEIEYSDFIDDTSRRFENQFVNISFPKDFFSRGMPVRHVKTNKFGVIETSTKDLEEFYKKIENDVSFEYMDMAISVVFLEDSGIWKREYINPIYLEVDVPNRKYYDESMVRAIEYLSDHWVKGDRGISESRVLEVWREYAEKCAKSKFPKNVTSLYDIIF